MANEKVSELPTVASATNADILYAIQGGVSVQETVQQISNRISDNVVLENAGDPNGSVAGTKNQLLNDTTNDVLWLCKTTGTSSTAVWIPAYGAMNNGELIVGNSGGVPQLATLTAGSGITVVNGAGSITVNATGIAFPWTEVTGTSQPMLPNNGYIANNAALVTLALPATAVLGDKLEVIGKGAGGWTISQAASQQIHIGANSTAVGIGGSVSSQNQYDSLTLICTVANTTWTALGAPQGPLTTV